MKFTVSFKDKRISSLFRFKSDYLDVYVDRKLFVLFSESSNLFTVLTLPVETVMNYNGPQLFRIPRTGFFNLLQEGIISFLCADDLIYMNVDSGMVSHTLTFDRQICSTLNLEDKLDKVKNAKEYPVFPVRDLVLPCKILKSSSVALTISNGVAFSALNGLHLYAKTQGRDCAVFPEVMNHLISVCDGDFGNVRDVCDYIIYSDGTYHVLVNKVTPHAGNDIDYVMRQRKTYETVVKFDHAIQLLGKVRDFREIDLNLRRQELILNSKGCTYSTRIFLEHPEMNSETVDIADILKTSELEIPVVRFPAEVFKDIIYAAKAKSLRIVCTKNRVRVSVLPGLMFVCRKELADG